MVALVFGQSNSANYGETKHKSKSHVYNLYNKKLYIAKDPLLGSTGDGGSVWTRLGDKIIQSGVYKDVIFIPIGVGSTEIARWTPEGDLHDRILRAIDDADSLNLKITHLLWHQGEHDAYVVCTEKEDYKRMFKDMLMGIRKKGVKAPIYVSVATLGMKIDKDADIRQAQIELVDDSKMILSGPDTDTLGYEYRYDDVHFSKEGLTRCADLWMEKLFKEEAIKDVQGN